MTDTLILPRHAPLEFRMAETLDVSFPERTITLIAVPYDAETLTTKSGRPIVESFAPGSFDGIELRNNMVKVNRNHEVRDTVGKVIAFHPRDARGLITDIRIGSGPERDQVLADARDGLLDASVAYAPLPFPDGRAGEVWSDNRTRRRITRAYLGHFALVPEPAYPGAKVLDVRDGEDDEQPASTSTTPNKDALLAMLFDKYGYRPGHGWATVAASE